MTAQSPIDITIAEDQHWIAVVVRGDIDLATAPELEAVCETSNGRLALDLSGVRFMDSSGLRSLFRLRDVCDALVLVAPSAVVRRLLALTSLTDTFPIVDAIEDLEPPDDGA
jgi:anti-anti-sigma factor